MVQVSKPGSVKVEKLMNVERYSHVMHISSTVCFVTHLPEPQIKGTALYIQQEITVFLSR